MAKVSARDRGVERTMERSYAPTGSASDDDGGDDHDSLVDNKKVVTEKNSNYLAWSRFIAFPLTFERRGY